MPVSKTDPNAIGCVRRWGCVCDGQITIPCPFHAIVEQKAMNVVRFGAHGIAPDALPLFPRSDGSTVAKHDIVLAIE